MKSFVAFACLALAAGTAAAQTPPTVQVSPLGPGSALLSLSAEGRSDRIPDLAVFSAGVVSHGVTASEALGANSRQMDRVIAALNDRRLTDENQDFITEGSKTVVQKLFNDIAPKFADRRGGYTRIIKLPDVRVGDGGELVLLQLLTDEESAGAPKGTVRRSAGLRRKRNEKRHQFAAKALKKPGEAAAA